MHKLSKEDWDLIFVAILSTLSGWAAIAILKKRLLAESPTVEDILV